MKIKKIITLKEVVNDLNDGKIFYEKRDEKLGYYFWDCLLVDIESLIDYAGLHINECGAYRMLAKRFPYAIYYLIDNEIVYVIGVLPMRRDPLWIKRKLKERS